MSLLASLGPTIVQSIVSVLVALYVRRLIRLNRAPVERLVVGVESLVGAVIATPIQQEKSMRFIDFRKGIAATLGVLLIGLCTWASTAGPVEALLEPILPAELRPLAGVLAGGIATVAGVVLARNGLKPSEEPAPSDEPRTLEVSPPGVLLAVPAATPVPAASAHTPQPDAPSASAEAASGPFWAGVPSGAPTSPTSLVQLPPIPSRRSFE